MSNKIKNYKIKYYQKYNNLISCLVKICLNSAQQIESGPTDNIYVMAIQRLIIKLLRFIQKLRI